MIKRLLFDSGNVLIYPKSNNWFFTDKLLTWSKLNKYDLSEKFDIAHEYLNKNHNVKSEAEELIQFYHFYKILLSNSNYKFIDALIKEISIDFVENNNNYILYEDVKMELKDLSKKYSIGIISDSWPSLRNRYKQIEININPFVISSEIGYTKETSFPFEVALSQISEKSNECLFIDDSELNCLLAKKLGFNVVIMDRKNKYNGDIYKICALNEIQEYIKKIS